MKYIISIIALLLTACTNPHSHMSLHSGLPNSSEFTEYNNFGKDIALHSYDIEGRYNLHRGLYLHGGIHREITQGYLVIEKLDDDDFGYYCAIKSGDTVANSFIGIFHHKNKRFYQKLIDGKKSTLRDAISIVVDTEKNRIKITTLINVGKRVIIWEKSKEVDIEQALILDETIEEARDSYTQIYKNRFID